MLNANVQILNALETTLTSALGHLTADGIMKLILKHYNIISDRLDLCGICY